MQAYLDYNSTAFPSRECINDFVYYADQYANPSAQYSTIGHNTHLLLEEARKTIADYIHANSNEVYFTSGSTESINWAIRGLCDAHFFMRDIFITPIEHPAVYKTALFCHRSYMKTFNYIPITHYGAVNIERFKKIILDFYRPLVCVIMANNEIGTINDIKAISELVHSVCGILFVDATQAICNTPINVDDMEIDLMAMSGHKIGAFSGSGFLYIKSGINITPLLYGGEQEHGMRAGTENFLYDVCLARQIKRLSVNEFERWANEQELRDWIAARIKDICDSREIDNWINGAPLYENRTPNNLNMTIKGIDNQRLISLLDSFGVVISAGSACSSGDNKPSRILKAIGLSDDEARNSIRISVDGRTTENEAMYFIAKFEEAIDILRA